MPPSLFTFFMSILNVWTSMKRFQNFTVKNMKATLLNWSVISNLVNFWDIDMVSSLAEFLISVSYFGVNDLYSRCTKRGITETTGFAAGGHKFFFLSYFFNFFSVILLLIRVSVNTGSIKQYLDPTEVLYAVQINLDDTSIWAIA